MKNFFISVGIPLLFLLQCQMCQIDTACHVAFIFESWHDMLICIRDASNRRLTVCYISFSYFVALFSDSVSSAC